jgi:hypothetical protein
LTASYFDRNTAVTFARPDFSRTTDPIVPTPPLPTRQTLNFGASVPILVLCCELEMGAEELIRREIDKESGCGAEG